MTPIEAYGKIVDDAEELIGREAQAFFTRLYNASPVYQPKDNPETGYKDPRRGGHFKASWRAPVKKDSVTWLISNTADYAIILAAGRYMALGRMYGSIQWRGGLNPMLQYTSNKITRGLDAIKY